MTELIFPTIERWHSIDYVLKNIELSEKPKDLQALVVFSGCSKKYQDKVRKFFENLCPSRFIVNDAQTIDHYDLREKMAIGDMELNKIKTNLIFDTYQIIRDNCDKSVDYYWIIEDDNLFPLNAYTRYQSILEMFGADIAAGISYYWHKDSNYHHNIFKIVKKNQPNIGKDDSVDEWPYIETLEEHRESGIVPVDGTGFCNVLIKKDAWLSFQPQELKTTKTGVDLAFFTYAKEHGFKAFADWSMSLPHITKHKNGEIEIIGRLKPDMLEIL